MNQDGISIETKRLRLLPMTYEFILKVMDDDLSAYDLLGAVKTASWPENADIKDILYIIRDNLAKTMYPNGFDAWLFISKSDSTVVGDGGFKGVPDENGTIDLGYAIIEAQRQRGFGFEAVSALMKWGLAQSNVTTVTADCLENNIPSINLLAKLGMKEINRKNGMIYFSISNTAV